jgi:hypothetical protein
MPKDTRSYVKQSEQFGSLHEGSAQVWQDFEPKDSINMSRLLEALSAHGEMLNPKMKNDMKRIRVISDLIMAEKYARNGLVFWPMGANEFSGGAYSYRIAKIIKEDFERRGWISLKQPASKKDGLARIYRISFPFDTSDMNFKRHGLTPDVIVKSRKTRDDAGRLVGGKRISLKCFRAQASKSRSFVSQINSTLNLHPLISAEGQVFDHGRRIFNNGSLTEGGRFYGPWQNFNEGERLRMRIDKEAVCEIDLKASYLNLSNILFDDSISLGDDPYERIGFVNATNDPVRRGDMRGLAKRLVATIIGNEGGAEPEERRSFPKGKKVWDDANNRFRTASVRDEFGLRHREKADTYYAEILTAFPFLRKAQGKWGPLMFLESEIVLGAVHDLSLKNIPAYPVHDSLICKVSDKDQVISALQGRMQHHLKTTFSMDVTECEKQPYLISSLGGADQLTEIESDKQDNDWEDDYISLIEED